MVILTQKNKSLFTVRYLTISMLLIVSWCSSCSKKDEEIIQFAVEKNKHDLPCLTIFVDLFWVRPKDAPLVILAVWPDGTAIYSKNRIEGGPPYYQKTIPLARVDSFWATIKRESLLITSHYVDETYIDSAHTCIYANNNENTIYWQSCHELEVDPNCVATEGSIEVIEGRGRKYKDFRKKWNLIRIEAEKLIQPEDADQINESIQFDYKRKISTFQKIDHY